MKVLLMMILALVLTGCNRPKGGIDELLKKNIDKTRMTTKCSCNKTMDDLLNAKSVELKTPQDVKEKFGNWDTSFSEIAVLACTSFVYKCGSKFVSFHFKPHSLAFIGRSYGDFINGKFSNNGDLIEFK